MAKFFSADIYTAVLQLRSLCLASGNSFAAAALEPCELSGLRRGQCGQRGSIHQRSCRSCTMRALRYIALIAATQAALYSDETYDKLRRLFGRVSRQPASTSSSLDSHYQKAETALN